MIETLKIWLQNSEKTSSAGHSLAHSLYTLPVTILLSGDLGAGKTTFLQGFAKELGISEHLTSPTYAIEQRYKTKKGLDFLHLDLYRLSGKDAVAIVDSTDDHRGIRCIEWSDRLPASYTIDRHIKIHLIEKNDGRTLSIDFQDIAIPHHEMIKEWHNAVQLPAHIIRHCDAVGTFAAHLGQKLGEQGIIVRLEALKAAGELHDLFRFIDFKGKAPDDFTQTDEQKETWNAWKDTFNGLSHEAACAAFLREKGYPDIATIIEKHGVYNPPLDDATIEQKLLFYADKRIIVDRVVTVDERFKDFADRYADGKMTPVQKEWYDMTKKIEEELFPDGTPFIV